MSAKAHTGQPLGEKPPALVAVYGADGSAVKVHPCDAKELLGQADGFYSSHPQAAAVADAPVIAGPASADDNKKARGGK